ncbi:MAG: exonuclease SbcCD subunit D [Promethearchaeota archaeon]
MTVMNYFEKKFGSFSVYNKETQDMVKFIHASDIHLGAVQFRNENRSNDFINAFQEILELAIIHRVNFILLAGDIFTSLEILPGKLTKIIKILNDFRAFSNRSILIIAIEGNHDIRKFSRGFRFKHRGQSWLKLLNSLGLIILLDANLEAPPKEMFSLYNFQTKMGGKIQIKNVMIYGTRYLGEKPISILSKIRKGIRNNKSLFNILLQHFGIEGQMENVPGVKLEDIQHLQHRIDYLALGHFHKQYIIQNWIYNPGSSEAVCSVDNSFKRGIFLVEISKISDKFVKKVKVLHLMNRKYLWETIKLNVEIKTKKKFEEYIINALNSSLKYLNYEIEPSNLQMPTLYLILKGKKPSKSCKVNEKDLRIKISEKFPIVDVQIYKKFQIPLRTLDNYILT